MKNKFLTPIIMVILVFTFGCAGTNESTDNQKPPMEVETADEADVIGDEADLSADKEDVESSDLFNNVDDTESYDMIELTKMEEGLSIFSRLLELSGLDASFKALDQGAENSEFTLLIPTDEAFKKMPEERYEYLINPENKSELIKVMRMHILPSKVYLADFNSSQIIETDGENEIPVDTSAGGNIVTIGGAQIVKSDIKTSNGVIHVVDAVIEPGTFTDVTID